MPRVSIHRQDHAEVEAQMWAASLPAPLGALEIAQLAPDITKRIASVWNDAPSASEFIEELLIGEHAPELSHEVTSGLLRIYEYNVRCRVNEAPETTWELPAARLHAAN